MEPGAFLEPWAAWLAFCGSPRDVGEGPGRFISFVRWSAYFAVSVAFPEKTHVGYMPVNNRSHETAKGEDPFLSATSIAGRSYVVWLHTSLPFSSDRVSSIVLLVDFLPAHEGMSDSGCLNLEYGTEHVVNSYIEVSHACFARSSHATYMVNRS